MSQENPSKPIRLCVVCGARIRNNWNQKTDTCRTECWEEKNGKKKYPVKDHGLCVDHGKMKPVLIDGELIRGELP